MATDFFERQEVARTNSKWLVILFVLAVIGIVGTSAGLATVAVFAFRESSYGVQHAEQPFPWMVPLAIGGGSLAIIGLGTLFKVLTLRGGGGAGLAEHIGGTRLYPNSTGLPERRLLNVVEEMALASGTPVPPVYVLEESGINAFAAGYSPSDAVIGVTRGAMETLSRSELQGVIAHEFSHILNGDMRLNIRLIGILHGILILGLIGHFLLRSFIYSGGGRSRRSSGKGDSGGWVIIAILAAAVALIVIGFLGNFIGGLIKAAVSRQREYLADASAVQFTRDPNGIAGALKQIGGRQRGSRIKHPNAPEASHMYFAKGVAEGFSQAMATHPPLEKRILAIEPTWNGVFPQIELAANSQTSAPATASGFAGAGSAAISADRPPVTSNAPQDVAPTNNSSFEPHHQYAIRILDGLDSQLTDAVHEPFGARAVVYGLLLDGDPQMQKRQLSVLDEMADKDVAALTRKLSPALEATPLEARLPLIDLSLPALRALSKPQYLAFDRCVRELIAADDQIELFEWTLGQVLRRHLRPQFTSVRAPRTRYYGLQQLSQQCSILLSTLAYAGHTSTVAATAFAAAAEVLKEARPTLLPKEECHLQNLHQALTQLREVVAKKKATIIAACTASICADRQVTVQEAELLRGIADLLDCPMPPLIAGQKAH